MYPDPFNRSAFENYIDRYPAHRLSLYHVRDEKAHWAAWLNEHDLVARAARPRKILGFQSLGLVVFGTTIGLLGPFGYLSGFVSNLLTALGFFSTVWGLFLSSVLRAEMEGPSQAAERVDFRIAELVSRRKALRKSGA
jgi:hypothetical protein